MNVNSGAHRIARSKKNADLAGIEIIKETLLGLGLPVVLHVGDLGRRHAETHEFIANPAVRRKTAAGLDADGAEIRENELAGAGFVEGPAVLPQIGHIAGLLPDAKSIGDEGVELVARFVHLSGNDEAQVDRGVAAVGDDGQEDIVAWFRRAVPLLDGLDAVVKQALIGLEGGCRLGRDNLPFAAGDRGHFDVVLQIVGQHDIREGTEHRDQLGDVDELRETRDGAVFAGGCNSSSVEVSPKVEAQASNSCRPRSASAA